MNIRETVTKPSIALRAMVEGLKDPGYLQVDMNMFYDVDLDIGACFGCAATCTLQRLTGKKLRADDSLNRGSTRAKFWGFDSEQELDVFEGTMDAARLGAMKMLFEYCRVDLRWNPDHDNRFCLDNPGWRHSLSDVEKFIERLEAEGL